MDFAEKIKALRLQRGMQQSDVAEALGYRSNTTIAKWESGVAEPPIKTVKVLAQLFGVSVSELLNDDDDVYTIAAHHDGEDWTQKELDEIEEFKRYVKSKRK